MGSEKSGDMGRHMSGEKSRYMSVGRLTEANVSGIVPRTCRSSADRPSLS